MALLDAWSLAIAVERSASLREALAAAVAQRSAHVALYQALTAVFTPVYQSDGSVLPWLRDRLIAPLSRLRWMNRVQAAMVSGMVGWPLNPLGLEVD